MLDISNLHASTEGKDILKGLSLKIKPGQIHALMGPNGSGKSSLAHVLMGHPRYRITEGKILLDKIEINSLPPDKRAKLGLFLAMQYPVAVPGVNVTNFLRTALKNLKDEIASPKDFLEELKQNLAKLKLDESFLKRYVNDGFSGGEKKKLEILQLVMLKPKYVLLDETDSGLDVDALKTVASGIKDYTSTQTGVLLITHYQRILKYIKPDFVHILVDGKIVKSGAAHLAEEIEEKGYETVKN